MRLLVPLLAVCVGCGSTDIRPEHLRESGVRGSDKAARELLAAACEAHGGWSNWRSHRTSRVVLTDNWEGWIGKWSMPWPVNGQRMQFEFLRDTFYGRAKMLGGPSDGEIWGVQAWKSYLIDNGKVEFRDHETTLFYIPTYQYFFEFPFRIANAGIVQSAGTRTLDGRVFDLVYATWGGAAPRPDVDQYVVWIGKDTRLIEKVQFTVRDKLRWATGVMRYSDFRSVDDIRVPFLMTVTFDLEETSYLHQMRIESVVFDAAAPDVFLADPSLPFTGDAKVVDNIY